MQNHWKNMRGAQNIFKCPLENLKFFPYFKYLNIIILLLLNILDGLARPSRKILWNFKKWTFLFILYWKIKIRRKEEIENENEKGNLFWIIEHTPNCFAISLWFVVFESYEALFND